MKTARIVALLAAVLAASCAMLAAAELEPAPAAGIHIAAEDTGSRFVALGVGKSVVVDLPRDIKDVLVANPAIANAIVRSARRAYLIGAAIGQTNVFFFDADGRQIAGFDIAVKRDLNGIAAAAAAGRRQARGRGRRRHAFRQRGQRRRVAAGL